MQEQCQKNINLKNIIFLKRCKAIFNFYKILFTDILLFFVIMTTASLSL
jgi:hypothetical protein